MVEINPWIIAGISGIAATISFALYRGYVGIRMRQVRRRAGPAHHLRKGDVPTGTGIVIVLLLVVAGILAMAYLGEDPESRIGIYVCWAAALVGMLGFVDDRAKVLRGSDGLKARFKLPVMIIVGLLFLYWTNTYFADLVTEYQMLSDTLPWPVENYAKWWLFYPVGLFVWLGALNGANFTDGLDGLLSCTTLVVLGGAFYALLDGSEPLALPAAVGFGTLVAFLAFNWKPALIYMGDSGSLTVGALVAGLFIAKGWWLFLGLCAIVWVLEVASVMLQVAVFRTTGRRLFLMTPIHHHFELAGWGERTTVVVFTLLQVLGCVTAFVWLRQGTTWGLAGTALLLLVFAILLALYHKRVATHATPE